MFRQRLWVPTMVACLLAAAPAPAAIPADQVPTFQLRCRVVSVQGKAPEGKEFAFSLSGQPAVKTTGDAWSEVMVFGKDQAKTAVGGYPNSYSGGWPVVVGVSVTGVVDPTRVEGELTLDEGGKVVKIEAELFGPGLGLLVWREADKSAGAATMAQYNQRFWKALSNVRITPEQRPRKYPVVDRFIGGDNDRLDWKQGLEELTKAGFSAIMMPPDAKLRRCLLDVGLTQTAWAVYNPPGYAFDYGADATPEAVDTWAKKLAEEYTKAGYKTTDVAIYTISDEPGWYFPSMFKALQDSQKGMARFRQYLQKQGLTPKDIGLKDWEELKPLGRAGAKDLPAKRLFHWTMRFFAWDSSRHFAACTAAMEKAFYPNIPILINWNNFSGRFYIPGPVANNPDKQNPDAAMGGHDWLEFGRLRGTTLIATEDWFGDEQAWQWSFYCSKLRSAAALGGGEFGALIIPRTAGSRPEGIVQKILTVVGSGAKGHKYFVFGPEYVFPGNCYSFKSEQILPGMAQAHKMLGAAEDVLWPGRRPAGEVAIVAPRSSQTWDAKNIPIPNQIQDMTNTAPWRGTVDYMAEVFCLYTALQHANIPVDFLDEDDLARPEALKKYKVIYLTAPNVPVECHRPVESWVKAGGTLVAVCNAASLDRYDDPADMLEKVFALQRKTGPRMLVANVTALAPAGKASGAYGEFEIVGPIGGLAKADAKARITLSDGTCGLVEKPVGKGLVAYYAFMPGMSYFRTGKFADGKLPEGFSESLRQCIAERVRGSTVVLPVKADRPMVETPILLSQAGAAVTVLNWTNAPIQDLKLSIRLPFKPATVESVGKGKIAFQKTPDGLECTLPVDAVDILMIRP